jgi:hypothetical protein
MGKRTIVIVDTPCVHQLLENYVSKLYAQAYSFCTVEVHGASGMDHFVHRFTHRVVRGVLIAVGRPDGRLCCLAKSEAAVLLSAKQAAFIRNPDYPGETSGPEIVTMGHNPYQPNVGLGHHIVLTDADPNKRSRRKFVDEYLYERLFLASKPFTAAILKALSLSRKEALEHLDITPTTSLKIAPPVPSPAFVAPFLKIKSGDSKLEKSTSGDKNSEKLRGTVVLNRMVKSSSKRDVASMPYNLGFSQHDFDIGMINSLHSHGSMHGVYKLKNAKEVKRGSVFLTDGLDKKPEATEKSRGIIIQKELHGEPLPYGLHHIDPSKAAAADGMFAEFIVNSKGLLTKKAFAARETTDSKKENSNDPAVRLAFSSRLDRETCAIQDSQVIVQQFYECRIASLERYIGFCVMFHAMAESSRFPWFHLPWDIARSQSNLRVATTASPISAGGDDHGATASPEIKKYARQLGSFLRGFQIHF